MNIKIVERIAGTIARGIVHKLFFPNKEITQLLLGFVGFNDKIKFNKVVLLISNVTTYFKIRWNS
jgi:hypothetical protein